jgi:hypothetical protein
MCRFSQARSGARSGAGGMGAWGCSVSSPMNRSLPGQCNWAGMGGRQRPTGKQTR